MNAKQMIQKVPSPSNTNFKYERDSADHVIGGNDLRVWPFVVHKDSYTGDPDQSYLGCQTCNTVVLKWPLLDLKGPGRQSEFSLR